MRTLSETIQEGIADYGYMNARIRAMKAQLLQPSDYDRLLAERDVDTLKIRLKETPYAPDIQKAETQYPDPSQVINHALLENLARTTRKLQKIAGGDAARYLSILLARWDIHNIKTLLRGRIRGASDTEIEASFMPAGALDPVRLKSLMVDKDPLKILDRLATWGISLPFVVGRDLNRMVREGKVEEMETYIDRSYFQWSLAQLNEQNPNEALLIHLLRRMIDIRNILASLVLIKVGTKPLGRIQYLEGGTLKRSVLRELENAETLEAAYEALQNTRYRKILEEKGIRSLGLVERALEWSILQEAYQMRFSDPLGIGIAIAYLFAKETEIMNIRTITYGLVFGLSKAEIREDLVFLTGS